MAIKCNNKCSSIYLSSAVGIKCRIKAVHQSDTDIQIYLMHQLFMKYRNLMHQLFMKYRNLMHQLFSNVPITNLPTISIAWCFSTKPIEVPIKSVFKKKSVNNFVCLIIYFACTPISREWECDQVATTFFRVQPPSGRVATATTFSNYSHTLRHMSLLY